MIKYIIICIVGIYIITIYIRYDIYISREYNIYYTIYVRYIIYTIILYYIPINHMRNTTDNPITNIEDKILSSGIAVFPKLVAIKLITNSMIVNDNKPISILIATFAPPRRHQPSAIYLL